ncbi:MAG: SCP2 sterol-binding domain-containing protein [Rhodothermales bacterium]|nr:SCP2 sterol-binding domain-containing protein [Rhodothermales bacterium]
MPEVFTAAWAADWCGRLESSESYHTAAASWKNPMVFILEADREHGIPMDRALYLDLEAGRCKGVRIADVSDEANVPYVVTGPLEAWRGLLDRRVDPMTTLLSGKLRLKKGSMFSLMPYAKAAYALLEAAMAVDSTYPTPT